MTEELTQALKRDLAHDPHQLDDVLATFLQAEKDGCAPPLAELTAQHPELAAELREFFADRESIQRLAAPVRAALTELTAGTAVRYFGDYEILAEIARGGMGVVYRARQVSLNRPVALKMILAGQLASAADVARFRAEAEAAAALDHPNIVPIHEVGVHQDQHYFSMKLVEGGSLAQWLAECRSGMRALRHQDQADIARLMETVARAVHFGHQRGILHRDLKPANILLHKDEGGRMKDESNPASSSFILHPSSFAPMVTDFGLAKKMAGGSDLTASGAIVGTPSYMAPEQAAGQKVVSTAVDVYSLGAILYELLTGRPPFRAETPLQTLIDVCEREARPLRSLDPHVDRDLETICLKCLEKEPSRRYGTAEALADDLHRWLAGEPIQARASTLWERTRKWVRRRPAQAALVGVTAAAIIALVVSASVFNGWLQVALADVATKQVELADARREVGVQQAAALAGNRLAGQHEEAARKAKEAGLGFQGEARKSAQLADERARRAEGTLLTAHSAAVRPANPGLALLLGIEGAQRAPGYLANNALLAALDECAEVRTFMHKGPVYSAVFSPDGARVLSCSEDNTAHIWDVATGKEVCPPLKHEPPVARFTDDGRPVRGGPREKAPRVPIAQFSPDGRTVLTIAATVYHQEPGGIYGGTVVDPIRAYLWNAATGAPIAQWQPGKAGQFQNASVATPVAVGFSPDSRRVATAFGHFPDCSAYVHDTATGKQVLILQGHLKPVVSARFSPDGARIVTASLDETARIWDAASGALLHTLKGHTCGVLSACFSPDSKLVVTTGGGSNYRFSVSKSSNSSGSSSSTATMENAAARIWSADTGKEIAVLRWPGPLKAFVKSAVFSSDGRRVLTSGNVGSSVGGWDDVTIRPNIWDAASGKLLVTLKSEPKTVVAAQFSPDGRHVATAGADKTVRVWDATTGAELSVLRGHEGALRAVCFSADGARLATAADDRTARVWDVRTGAWSASSKNDWLAIWPGTFSPDGKRLYLPPPTPARQFTARVLDTATGMEIARANGVKWRSNAGARFSPDGRWLLTGDGQGEAVRLVDAATLKEVRLLGAGGNDNTNHGLPVELTLNAGKLGDMAFSPDGLKIVTADGTGKIWEAKSGRLLHVLDGGKDHPICGAHFSADSRRLVTLSAGAGRSADPGPTETVTGTVDGKETMVPNAKCTARIWDVDSGKQIAVLQGHAGQVHVAAFSPDGERVVTASHDGTVRLWDATNGKQLALFKGHRGGVGCAVFNPDGQMVLTAGDDKTARLWDAHTGEERYVLIGHDGPVRSASFSPDGNLVLTCSGKGASGGAGVQIELQRPGSDSSKEDGTARLWNARTGKPVCQLTDPLGMVATAAFSADGRSVLAIIRGEVSHASRSSARIWPTDPLSDALARKPRELTANERARFEIDGAARP
jgi:eukaryotic-like serine/threonine-protein kinase